MESSDSDSEERQERLKTLEKAWFEQAALLKTLPPLHDAAAKGNVARLEGSSAWPWPSLEQICPVITALKKKYQKNRPFEVFELSPPTKGVVGCVGCWGAGSFSSD